ncbi:hypothetical protein [Rhodococcus sp. NPDC127528]|uniref:hypothetical protein n=1 Tax=unclassified Rhodococcus (in: high G+C Gram-positive bacteria) TaxID=192944 RepID=UPI00362DA225
MSDDMQQMPDGDDQPTAVETTRQPGSAGGQTPVTWWQTVHKAMTTTTQIVLPWWTVYAAAAFLPFVLVLGFCSRWGANQWGNVASWLSGFATLLAVVVALRQAALARRHADELYERQARAANLAVQRSELMVLWPVLEETELVAHRMLPDPGVATPDRDEWNGQLARCKRAYSRARLFLHDEQVQVAIGHFVEAVDLLDQQLKSIEREPQTFKAPGVVRQVLWMRIRHITVTRIALRDKAAARLTDFVPDEVVKRADAWSAPTAVDDL